MKTLDQIKHALDSIEFNSVEHWLSVLLQAFDIPDITIRKILDKIGERRNAVPVSLYRRTVFLYSTEDDDLSIFTQYLDTYPIVFILKDSTFSFSTGSFQEVGIPYSNVSEYVVQFQALQNRGRIEKDLFSTLDFAPIVAELNSRLCLLDNDPIDAFNYIIDLIFVAFVDQILEQNVILKYEKWMQSCEPNNLNGYVSQIIFEGEYKQFLHLTYQDIKHNAHTKELVIKLLKYDVKGIDSEVLGSIVYKIFASTEESTLYGNQTAKTYINRLLEALFVIKFRDSLEKLNYDDALQILEASYFDPTNSPGSFIVNAFLKLIELSNEYAQASHRNAIKIDYANFVSVVDNDIALRLTKLNFFIVCIQYQFSYFRISKEIVYNIFNGLRIYKDNQLRCSWESYCPNNGNVYIIGSPTFKGNRKLSVSQKNDMKHACGFSKITDADYSSAWLIKGANYISGTKSSMALVLTNSVCQGTQVATIWKPIYQKGCQISFAYNSFKWMNPENKTVAVSVVMIGLQGMRSDAVKLLFNKSTCFRCRSIGPYLIQNSEVIVEAQSSPISPRPRMIKGNMPYAADQVLFDIDTKTTQVQLDSGIEPYIRKVYGSKEFMDNAPRYCLWIADEQYDIAITHPFIKAKMDEISSARRALKDCPKKLLDQPHKFRENNETNRGSQSLIVPSVSSENRQYHPMGFVYNDSIVTNLSFAIYDCEIWILALLVSRMHNVWSKLVCGQLESRNRYSNELAYNTFPFPHLSDEIKETLKEYTLNLIKIREEFCEVPIGRLYSDMPPKLKNFHAQIDEYVDSLYSNNQLFTDYDRRALLISMYESSINV